MVLRAPVILAVAVLLSLASCAIVGDCSYEELARVMSPDGVVDAVWIQGNCGATTDYSLHLFVVPAKTPFSGATGLFDLKFSQLNADHVSGLRVEWPEPQLLSIAYSEARIFHFSNVWSAREVHDFRYVVELRLDPQSHTFSVPYAKRHW